jgi:hypothetical protein
VACGSTALAVLVALVLVLSAAACSSSSHSQDGSPDSTSTPATPATSLQPVPPAVPISIPTATDGTSPDGSGCDPASGATLPNGIWFGVLKSVDTTTDAIGLDLACWFSGASAQAATGSTGPVDDDHYVRNQNPKIYTLPTVAKVAVVPLAQAANGEFTGGTGAAQTGLASAQAILAGQSDKYVWIEITDGLVTVIQAQFTP